MVPEDSPASDPANPGPSPTVGRWLAEYNGKDIAAPEPDEHVSLVHLYRCPHVPSICGENRRAALNSGTVTEDSSDGLLTIECSDGTGHKGCGSQPEAKPGALDFHPGRHHYFLNR